MKDEYEERDRTDARWYYMPEFVAAAALAAVMLLAWWGSK